MPRDVAAIVARCYDARNFSALRRRSSPMRPCAVLLLSVIPIAAVVGAQDASSRYRQSYSSPALRGETLLENDRIVVQKFVIPPGTWEGQHTHPGNQLWVQMTDGEWTSHADRTQVSRLKAGSVGWLPPSTVLRTTKAASIPGRLRLSWCG